MPFLHTATLFGCSGLRDFFSWIFADARISSPRMATGDHGEAIASLDVDELVRMLARCQSLEERAAAVYRAFATVGAARPELCALWTALAREEDEHAKTLAMAQLRLAPGEGVRTHLEGWNEAMEEIEEHLAVAGQQANGASTDRQLEAALQLEMSELESLRRALLAASDHDAPSPNNEAHAEHLAQAATRLSTDPQVRLLAALLLARARLKR